MLYYENENIKQRMFFFVTIRDQMRLLLQRNPDTKGQKSLIWLLHKENELSKNNSESGLEEFKMKL